jgi:hypothetical protein
MKPVPAQEISAFMAVRESLEWAETKVMLSESKSSAMNGRGFLEIRCTLKSSFIFQVRFSPVCARYAGISSLDRDHMVRACGCSIEVKNKRSNRMSPGLI